MKEKKTRKQKKEALIKNGFSGKGFAPQNIKLDSDKDDERIILKNKCNVIAKKFKFRQDYDLLFDLDKYIANIEVLHNEILRQTPTDNEEKTFLIELKETIETMCASIKKTSGMLLKIGPLYLSFKKIMKENYDNDLSSLILTLTKLAEKYPEDRVMQKKEIESLNLKRNELPSDCVASLRKNCEDFHNKNQDDIIRLIYLIDQMIPKNVMKGRKKGSLVVSIIENLMIVFINGTGERPTCGWKDIEEKYKGEFYNFLIAIKKVFKKSNLCKTAFVKATNFTIGKNAMEIIKNYKERIDNLLKLQQKPPEK